MAKVKDRDKQYSVNKKVAKSVMTNCNTYMDQIKAKIGKAGDGDANAKTLFGAMERYNDNANSGATMTNSYNNFNKKSLPAFRKELAKIDKNIENIDLFA